MSKSSREAVVSGVKPWLTASSYATDDALLPGICISNHACDRSIHEPDYWVLCGSKAPADRNIQA